MAFHDDVDGEDIGRKDRYKMPYGRKTVKLPLHSSSPRYSSTLSRKFTEEMERREAAEKESLIELYASRVNYRTKGDLFA
jgi:hypothetical protein